MFSGDSMTTEIKRSVIAGGLWVAISSGLLMAAGAPLNLSAQAIEGGLMAAALYGSDVAHKAVAMSPTSVSSAAVTGAVFAGLMKVVSGSDAYLTNAVAGGAVDFVTEMALESYDAMPASSG